MHTLSSILYLAIEWPWIAIGSLCNEGTYCENRRRCKNVTANCCSKHFLHTQVVFFPLEIPYTVYSNWIGFPWNVLDLFSQTTLETTDNTGNIWDGGSENLSFSVEVESTLKKLLQPPALGFFRQVDVLFFVIFVKAQSSCCTAQCTVHSLQSTVYSALRIRYRLIKTLHMSMADRCCSMRKTSRAWSTPGNWVVWQEAIKGERFLNKQWGPHWAAYAVVEEMTSHL